MGLAVSEKRGDSMADRLHLKVILDCTVDLNYLWGNISKYPETHLGGEDKKYTVQFNGSQADGLEVLKHCLATGCIGKFYADFGA